MERGHREPQAETWVVRASAYASATCLRLVKMVDNPVCDCESLHLTPMMNLGGIVGCRRDELDNAER